MVINYQRELVFVSLGEQLEILAFQVLFLFFYFRNYFYTSLSPLTCDDKLIYNPSKLSYWLWFLTSATLLPHKQKTFKNFEEIFPLVHWFMLNLIWAQTRSQLRFFSENSLFTREDSGKKRSFELICLNEIFFRCLMFMKILQLLF